VVQQQVRHCQRLYKQPKGQAGSASLCLAQQQQQQQSQRHKQQHLQLS
jgi:hypothetical protein